MLRATPALVLGAWLIALALPLAALAYAGWFSRYASDDYCTAGMVVERGYLGAQAYWYAAWSGRFSFTALVSALELLGVGAVRVLPGLALLAAVAAGAWALAPFAGHQKWAYPRLSALVVTQLVVFGTYVASPNVGQSLLWQTGVLTYLLPLILGTVYAGYVARQARWGERSTPPAVGLVGVGLMMCVSGGLSETTLVVQVAGLGVAVVLVAALMRGPGRRHVLALLVAGLLGSLLAAVIVGLAPGNVQRLRQESYPGGTLSRVPLALRASASLLYTFARRFEGEFRPAFLACALVPAAYAAWLSARENYTQAGLGSLVGTFIRVAVTLVVGGLLTLMSFFPSYWVLGFDPPARIELVSQALVAATVVVLGYWSGRFVGGLRLPGRRPRVAVGGALAVGLLALTLVPVTAAAQQAGQTSPAAAYARMWDRNDQILRAAGEQAAAEVTVPALPAWWGWDWVGPQPGDFPNRCVARYYGLGEVRSVAESAS